MRGAGVTQPVGDPRRAGVDDRHRGILRVEQAEDVAVQAVAFGRQEGTGPVAVVDGELLDVRRPARRVPDGVQQHLDATQPGIAVQARTQLDDLGVHRRTGIPMASTSNCQNCR